MKSAKAARFSAPELDGFSRTGAGEALQFADKPVRAAAATGPGPVEAAPVVATIERISETPAGGQSTNASLGGEYSPDGTKIAFVSITPVASGGGGQIMMLDVASGVVTQISSFPVGFTPIDLQFSPDGTKLGFTYRNPTVLTNTPHDVALYDIATGTLTVVSTDTSGDPPGDVAFFEGFSPDGNLMLIRTKAPNWDGSRTHDDIFAKNLTTGELTLMTTNSSGGIIHGDSSSPSFSPDGTQFLFTSAARDVVPPTEINDSFDVYLKDLATGVVTRVETNGFGASFSPDGTKILFITFVALVAGDTNSDDDAYIKDLASGIYTRVSITAGGVEGNDHVTSAAFSPDGTMVLLHTRATNLAPGDANNATDVFIKDLVSGELILVTRNTSGVPGDSGSSGEWSPDGTAILFSSQATDFVAGDTNSTTDVFLAHLDFGSSGFITGTSGPDNLVGTGDGEVLQGLGGDDVMDGAGGNDAMFGGEGSDEMTGGPGNDYIDGGAGADDMTGGLGNDTYVVDDAADEVHEAVGGGNDRVYALVSWVMTAGSEVEVLQAGGPNPNAAIDLTGNEFANNVWGNEGANGLYGEAGNDALFGFGGMDYLDGGAGTDFLVGGAGDDVYVVDSPTDTVIEAAGQGQDRVYALASYTLNAGAEVEIMQAGGPSNVAAINMTGNEFANNIWDNAGGNHLYGMGGNDAVFGFAGDDYLDGGAGADFLVGGTGDDVFVVDTGDIVVELAGEGSDRVYAVTSYTLNSGQEVEILAAGGPNPTAALDLTGNELANNLWGNAGNNALDGGAGNDAVFGFDGNDSLLGGDGADLMAGGIGHDSINGGAGADTLLGDSGNDTFTFNSALGGGNVDAIGDFVAADDTIALENAVFTGLTAGALAAGAFATGAAAGDADDRIIYNNATGALFFDADGNGAGAAIQFATLQTGLTLTASDFMVI